MSQATQLKIEVPAQTPVRTRNYFRACGIVLADTIVNGAYGIDSKKLSKAAEAEKELCPRVSKTVESLAKYGFWTGTAYLGMLVSRATGPEFGYTAACAHPFIVSGLLRASRERHLLSDPKPSLPIFMASFGLLELASTPLFIGVTSRIAALGSGPVNPALAAASVTAGFVCAMSLEYLGLRFLWRKLVLRNVEGGSVSEELRAFRKSLRPLGVFSDGVTEPARSAVGYTAQVFGTVCSLWVWAHLASVAVAVALTQIYNVQSAEFIDFFYQKTAQWGKKFFEVLLLARCWAVVDGQIKRNNEALGLDGNHS